MRTRSRYVVFGSLLLAALIVTSLLYFYAPEQHRFYPRCLLNQTTGLECPGCGTLRAAHELLHGNVAAAFKLNPLFLVVLLPFLSWLAIVQTARSLFHRQLPNPFLRPWFAWTLTGLFITFGIARNL